MTPMQHKPIIIGLAGRAGSGKNFVACQIQGAVSSLDCFCEQYSFAGPLKDTVAAMFGIDRGLLNTERGKQTVSWYNGMTYRELLQFVGTDVVREHVAPDFWVNRMESKLDKTPDDIVLITDVRFTNEAELIWRYGGKVLRVDGRANEEVPAHVSENGDFVVDGTVENPVGTTGESLVLQVAKLDERLLPFLPPAYQV